MSTISRISTSGWRSKSENILLASEPGSVFESRSCRIFIISENEENFMCRNIKTLHNFVPPATEEEIRASSLQFVRKLSGFTKPSKANEEAFARAVDQVTEAARELLRSLVSNTPPRDREVEALKARARLAKRFGSSAVSVPQYSQA
jgi:hypothetical protein